VKEALITSPTGVNIGPTGSDPVAIPKDVLEGGVIMPKLENATAKSVTHL
jgi:hypothetical protein